VWHYLARFGDRSDAPEAVAQKATPTLIAPREHDLRHLQPFG
jgi:hypothetical protein